MVDSLHMKSILGSQRGLTNAGYISSMAVRARHRPCWCLAAGMPAGPAGRAFVEVGNNVRLVQPLRDTATKAVGGGAQNTQYNIMQDFLRMNLAHAPVSADGASLVVDHLTYQPAGTLQLYQSFLQSTVSMRSPAFVYPHFNLGGFK